MFKKSPLKATRLHKRKQKRLIYQISIIVLAIVLLIDMLALLSYIPLLAITEVHVSGNAGIDENDIKDVINRDLTGSYLSIFSRANKLIYAKAKIEEDIRNAFPSIKSFSIKTHGHNLAVNIMERKPSYLWCKGMPTDVMHDYCYFMDETGFIYAEAPEISGDAYFTFFGGTMNDKPIGSTFLSSTTLDSLTQFRDGMEQLGIGFSGIAIANQEDREVYLLKHGKIIFKSDQNPIDVIAAISLLKDNTKLFNPHATTTIDYIDLRYGNKVYYKLIGDNTVQTKQ